MPLTATGVLAKTIVVDTVQITNFQVNLFPIGAEFLRVNYASGFNDANEIFQIVENHKLVLTGDEFAVITASTPDTSLGLYEALKTILYAEVEKVVGV